MENTAANVSKQQNWLNRSFHASLFSRHLWQLVFAWSLILIWSSIFCVFLEGKSSYDLAFTLWDDQYAKLPTPSLFTPSIIIPQFAFYTLFFILTALFVAMLVNSPHFKQITACILLATSALLVCFVAGFGIVTINFLGGRQGSTGWTILEFPWISLLLFCFGNASGMIGMWFLIMQEIPRITTKFKGAQAVKKWLVVIATWSARILIITGLILSSLALNAGLILAFNHVNAVFVIAACGCVLAIGISFFKNDIFKTDFKKMKQQGKKQVWLFTPDPIVHEDGTELNRCFDFFVNPRNIAWRSIRNLFNGILTAVCMFLVAAICFMTVPDEWVFPRFLDLLPWIIVGVLVGTVAMAIIPEPAFYYPATIIYFGKTYTNFLADFSIPFEPGFIAINGSLLGFWIAVFIFSQFYMHRAKTRGRNFNLTIFLMLTLSLTWMMLCLAGRFQHNGSAWETNVTAVVNVLLPIILPVAQIFLIISMAFWGLDIIYRIYRKYKPPASSRQTKLISLQASRPQKERRRMLALPFVIPERKKKIMSLLVLGIFIGSFSVVQMTAIYGNQVRPLLFRNDDFGIWTVDAVTKVEKDFPIQMPDFAPIASNIEIAAARGEWNGFHLLISPQPEKSVTLAGVNWTAFKHESGSESINASSMSMFLVSYLVDEQPDQLLDLSPRLPLTRTNGEHVDLYFQELVPRNATAGIFDATIHLTINSIDCPVLLHLQVYNFTIPANNHLRTAFGGGWNTEQWYNELNYLRISQQNMGIPFSTNDSDASVLYPQYWWNSNTTQFQFNWTAYDAAFQAQLDRNFTGFNQGYFPDRPSTITNDTQWKIIEAQFLHDVSVHLESKAWVDQTGTNHSWIEIPYYYAFDEPPVSEYPLIKETYDRYHANGTSQLRTFLTAEFDSADSILNSSVDEWCPVINDFEPSTVVDRHATGQQYWFYVCVAPVAPYPDMQLWEQGNDPELLPFICARFNADGVQYWSMTSWNETYRAGFDGNGDGQIAFADPLTGQPLPSLRLLSFSLGIEDYECIWLMRATVQDKTVNGTIPAGLLARAAAMETRLNDLVGARPSFVNHDPNSLMNFKSDLSQLLEDLWPYSEKLYA
ncbi:MAG TPA: glycoside hydrolase domain-containing protein [Candidatus Lokiarchaeia archaeon]|nr:glycoside hydrolase domain-containing protein [Candidatus Lokiarchaeia archaeon]